MKNFKELKQEILKRAKSEGACKEEYQRAYKSETIEELIEVIKDNISWNNDHNILTSDLANEFENPKIFNHGESNVGLFNNGDRNSGDLNSGDVNSGNRNSGYRNSGDQNSGHRNVGYRNNGELNSGDRNVGYRNSGDLNDGYRNSGYRNNGDLNSGDLNNGCRNSGDLNSGYRNSGVFCTRKRDDTVPFFNQESNMTWDEWYNHDAYDISIDLEVTKWVDWESMTDNEKKNKPKAFVTGGYLKVYDYKEAWANLWAKLSDKQKNSFKTLPNYDPDIFEEVTGIRFE